MKLNLANAALVALTLAQSVNAAAVRPSPTGGPRSSVSPSPTGTRGPPKPSPEAPQELRRFLETRANATTQQQQQEQQQQQQQESQQQRRDNGTAPENNTQLPEALRDILRNSTQVRVEQFGHDGTIPKPTGIPPRPFDNDQQDFTVANGTIRFDNGTVITNPDLAERVQEALKRIEDATKRAEDVAKKAEESASRAAERAADKANKVAIPTKMDLAAMFNGNHTELAESKDSLLSLLTGGESDSRPDHERRALADALERMAKFQMRLNATADHGNATDAEKTALRIQEKVSKILNDIQDGKFTPRDVQTLVMNHDQVKLHAIPLNNTGDANANATSIRFSLGHEGTELTGRLDLSTTTAGGASNSSTNATAPISNFGVAVGFVRLVEIDDTNTLNNSTSHLEFGDFASSWTSLAASCGTVQVDGASVLKCSSSLVPGGQWGPLNITVSFYFSGDVVPVDGTIAKPSSFKYSLSVTNYPYHLSTGRLVIVNRIHTDALSSVVYDTVSQSLLIDDGSAQFSWDQEIVADGTSAAVEIVAFGQEETAANSTESVYRVSYAFPQRVASIEWDPEVSFNEASLVTTTSSQAVVADPTQDNVDSPTATATTTPVPTAGNNGANSNTVSPKSGAAPLQASWSLLAAMLASLIMF